MVNVHFVKNQSNFMETDLDIVYTVKEKDDNEELRYSLRSLKNIPHNRVFIVGYLPKFINPEKVIHIRTFQNQTKYKNTTSNLFIICTNKELSNDFILMNDDFFILKPILEPERELNKCRGTVEAILRWYKAKYSIITKYMKGMQDTRELLINLGFENPLSYELHIPMVLNKKKFLSMWKIAPEIDNIDCLHKRTLYGNLFKENSEKMTDVKVIKEPNAFFYPHMKLVSTSDATWPLEIGKFIQKTFPEKCIYEK